MDGNVDGRKVYNRIRNEFDLADVIDSFEIVYVNDCNRRGVLMDFLPQISLFEMDILKSWENHFRERGIPYAIAPRKSDPKELVLWKEQYSWGKGKGRENGVQSANV